MAPPKETFCDEVGDIGGAEVADEGLDELDGEAEKKGIEEDFKKSRVTVFEEGGWFSREGEGSRKDGHDDVKSNFYDGAAVVSGEIDEGLEIHGDVGVVEDEGEGGEDGHESEKKTKER